MDSCLEDNIDSWTPIYTGYTVENMNVKMIMTTYLTTADETELLTRQECSCICRG